MHEMIGAYPHGPKIHNTFSRTPKCKKIKFVESTEKDIRFLKFQNSINKFIKNIDFIAYFVKMKWCI